MKNDRMRKAAAGTVSAQNIQRQPISMFQGSICPPMSGRAIAQLAICAARMPSTIVIWLRLTSRPRTSEGDTSAMYIGEMADARPMPTPPTRRAMQNSQKLLKMPVAMALTVKSTAATISNGRRP